MTDFHSSDDIGIFHLTRESTTESYRLQYYGIHTNKTTLQSLQTSTSLRLLKIWFDFFISSAIYWDPENNTRENEID